MPVQDLAAHGAADLAAGSWCNLDFPLARMWGGTLQRHGTLASGAGQCDFRFLALAAAKTGRAPETGPAEAKHQAEGRQAVSERRPLS